MEHFGCGIKTKNPKLSRSNYAPITLSMRKNGSMNLGLYSVGQRGYYSSIDEAVSDFFKNEGDAIVDEYITQLDEYRKLIYNIRADKNLAKGYYASYIESEYKRFIYIFLQ